MSAIDRISEDELTEVARLLQRVIDDEQPLGTRDVARLVRFCDRVLGRKKR